MTKCARAEKGKKFAAAMAAAVIFSCCIPLFACSKNREAGAEYLGEFLSAEVWLVLSDDIKEETFLSVKTDCERIIKEAENALSTEIEGSEVYRFNRLKTGEQTKISKLFSEVIGYARDAYERTGGAFDPSAYPLVDLWGFSARFDGLYSPRYAFDRARNEDGSLPLPDATYVEAFISLVDFSAVGIIEDGGETYLKKNCPSVKVDGEEYYQQIDMSAIAKGYLADRLVKAIEGRGVKNYYLSIGTSSVYLGDGKKWDTELTDPSKSGASFAKISLCGTGVTTSGTYENVYSVSGRVYHHIIDVETGESADTDILSVAVIGKDLVFADALSTALVAMGYERAREFIKDYTAFDFVFVLKSGEVFTDADMVLLNDKYVLKRI